jgi:L-amino acid N-acyltransferase YncA
MASEAEGADFVMAFVGVVVATGMKGQVIPQEGQVGKIPGWAWVGAIERGAFAGWVELSFYFHPLCRTVAGREGSAVSRGAHSKNAR